MRQQPKNISTKKRSARPLRSAALVTGAAKRLGRCIALDLAEQGYDIALHYNQSKAEAIRIAKDIDQTGLRCELFCCNLADAGQTRQLMADVYKSFSHINLLINSASIFVPNQFGALNLDLFEAHWNINYRAPYILSCEFARLVKKGQIINLIDTNVSKYQSPYADYLMTKKALAELTKMSAVAWGPDIRVNGVSPGMILPPVNQSKDDRYQRARSIPLRSVGDPQFILQTIRFILNNTYLTGQIIAVDGGEGLVS